MKMLFACLSFVFTFSAFGESPIPIEPMLLEALLSKAGTIKVQDSYSGKKVKLSYILSEAMGYPYDGDKSVIHSCDSNIKGDGLTCTFSIMSKYGDDSTTESAIMINYDAVYDEKSEAFKVSNVRVDYAG
jgi:hypothetical protein